MMLIKFYSSFRGTGKPKYSLNKRQEMESRGEIFSGKKVSFSLLCGVPKGVGADSCLGWGVYACNYGVPPVK